jgi:biopolymer transport protein ExbB
MKSAFACAVVVMLAIAGTAAVTCHARDMRALSVQVRQARQELLNKAEAERETALKEAEASRQAIMAGRTRLENAVNQLNSQNEGLKKEIGDLSTEAEELERREAQLARELAETDSVMRELVGVIRINAKDIGAMIEQSLQTALGEDSTAFLRAIAGQSRFPGMADIEKMAAVLEEHIRQAGEVRLTHGPMVDRTGNPIEADLLLLGPFTAAYRTDKETGFLTYSATGKKLFALSKLPDRHLRKQLIRYMAGEQDTVPLDVSRGGALRQLTHALSLFDQIPKGGPIVWPILAILGLGLAIIGERVFFLLRRRLDADGLALRIENMAAQQNWQECQNVCRDHSGKPVARVMAAGLDCCQMQREAMENALQEAILREVPAMERFLSTLGMLAAIAPLLGLLGTVTGMIETFHVITQFGTGDPRMMSGGISEALVTTMLGLSVAIPIMLAHTLLNRAVDKRVGQMEEKAVALVNIVHKSQYAAN